jgi:hypothetical protein
MVGSAATRNRVVDEPQAELAPWVDSHGLRIATEVNTGLARR